MAAVVEMTDFQKRIHRYLKKKENRGRGTVSTWEIAQAVFPEVWKKRAARGALVGHVRRATERGDFFWWHPPRDEHSDGSLSLRTASK